MRLRLRLLLVQPLASYKSRVTSTLGSHGNWHVLRLCCHCRLPHYCPVCAYQDWNLDGLVDMIWDYLKLLRIYTKPKVNLIFWLGTPSSLHEIATGFQRPEICQTASQGSLSMTSYAANVTTSSLG